VVENPSREEAPPELAKWGSGIRAVEGIVAVVSASALVGGGIGMLGGVALGAINPFALGIIGAVGGIGAPVLFAVGARRATRRPWSRRWFGS
jgi:hypothetical protein